MSLSRIHQAGDVKMQITVDYIASREAVKQIVKESNRMVAARRSFTFMLQSCHNLSTAAPRLHATDLARAGFRIETGQRFKS